MKFKRGLFVGSVAAVITFALGFVIFPDKPAFVIGLSLGVFVYNTILWSLDDYGN